MGAPASAAADDVERGPGGLLQFPVVCEIRDFSYNNRTISFVGVAGAGSE